MVRWLRWHCPPDTGFEIRALAVWGRARYLSVTEAPHNTNFHTWMGKKQFCFFQTAETGNRTPDYGVKGSGANHYPRAPALAAFKTTEYSQVSKLNLINAFLHMVLCCPMCRVIMYKVQNFLAINMQFSRPSLILYEYKLSVNVSQVTLDVIKLSIYFSSYPWMSARMLSSYPWVSTGNRRLFKCD